jgi:phage pi2 protein 07
MNSMQQLNVNLTIPIPAGSVLISKVELEELKRHELTGVYWSMKDLEARTNRKSEWLKEHILFRPRFKKVLDSETGGFVYYPKARGQTWSFQASRMSEFLEKHFAEIFADKGGNHSYANV